MLKTFSHYCALIAILFPLTSCVTTSTQNQIPKAPPITVSGTMFYPDDYKRTIVVPSGAVVVGANGTNCKYVVENGGRMSAYSGTNNHYLIKRGGAFKGFDHAAKNCKVEYENGASVEQVEAGEGVYFIAK